MNRAIRRLESVTVDLRVSLRAWRRSPGSVAVAVLTLALGIGATTALFSVVHGILLEPLPYRNAEQLVVIRAEQDFEGARQPARATYPSEAVAAWPSSGQTFEQVAFYAESVGALAGKQTSELVDVAIVAGPFFETVSGQMAVGRGLATSDDTEPVAVISARLWRRLDSTAGDVPGRPIVLNGQALTIVGVSSDTFQIPGPHHDVWIPAGVARLRNPSCCGFTPIARLKPGMSVRAATDEFDAVTRRLGAEWPRALADTRVLAIGLRDAIVADARPALAVLAGAVGLLLVLACANVMNLLVARNTSRSREVAVRRALGASWNRLVAQALVESALLVAAGGVAGMALAALAVQALEAWSTQALPRLDNVSVDGTVLTFSVVVSGLVALVLGLLPALQSRDVQLALKVGQRGSTGSPRTRMTLRAVIVAQLAVSVVLLFTAGLLGRSLFALMRTDLGVTSENVVTASLNLAMDRTLTDGQQVDLVNRIVGRLSASPYVIAAGAGTARPPDTSRVRLTLNRSDDPHARASYQAAGVPATPGYFRALDIRLERGRLFTEADDAGAPPVVLLSTDTARRLFGGEDPLGKTIGLPVLRDGLSGREDMTVVGITANVKYSGLDQMADDVVYRPFAQQPWRSVFLVVRAAGDSATLTSQLQSEISAVDRAVTVSEISTLDAVLAEATAQPRLRTLLIGAFAAAAVLIAGVGLYGVIAYSASQRSDEFGVRMALGADGRRIRWMVLREGLGLAVVGSALGLAGAYTSASLLASLLFGIQATDPASFVFATVGVMAAGLAASYRPASRAARTDPLTVLRAE